MCGSFIRHEVGSGLLVFDRNTQRRCWVDNHCCYATNLGDHATMAKQNVNKYTKLFTVAFKPVAPTTPVPNCLRIVPTLVKTSCCCAVWAYRSGPLRGSTFSTSAWPGRHGDPNTLRQHVRMTRDQSAVRQEERFCLKILALVVMRAIASCELLASYFTNYLLSPGEREYREMINNR